MGQLTFARILRSNSLPVNFSDFFVQKIRVHVWEVRHMSDSKLHQPLCKNNALTQIAYLDPN